MKYYEIKVQLKGTTKPPIWRKLRIDPQFSFWQLHRIIQLSMGWEDCHLHQFIVGNRRENCVLIKTKDDIEMMGDMMFSDEMIDEDEVLVEQFLKNPKDKLIYEYDFGDSWEHEVVLEKIVDSKEELYVPFLMDAKGACPPEDCGGIGGYERMKEVMANPKLKENKEEYKMFSEWLGAKKWDAESFDIEYVNDLFSEEVENDDMDMEDLMELMDTLASRERNPILLNLSNHPKDSWSKEQLKAAKKQFGEVVDLPFPNVPPTASEDEVMDLVDECFQKVMEINPAAVHVMGEMNFTFLFVLMAERLGVECYASTSERNVVMTKDGKKEVTFSFVQFRKYVKVTDN